jgi:prepilin-type N-terminal cleavage/methylation domain-containing protein
MKSNKNEKGFSLVELLVVVIIIAIVAAIAIPNLLASRRAANEASAVSSLRTIHSAQATYFATVPASPPSYGTLVQLNTAGLIDSALGAATSQKSGYTFNVTLGPQIYCATGVPQSATTGTNYYGVETEGVIWKHTAALTCAAGDLTPAGNPIQ